MKIRDIILSMYNWGKGCGITRYHPFDIINQFIVNKILFKMKQNHAIIRGNKMVLDDKDLFNLSILGIHEPMITDIVERELKISNTVIDIGANIGYYTLIFAKLVGNNGKVIAFEPHPYYYSLLAKNIEINKHDNVIIEQKAVSDKTEMVQLYFSPNDNIGDHRIYDSGDCRHSIPVKAVALDDYVSNLDGKIDLIKMDIQGAEYKALKGMVNILKNNDDIKIITEFWPIALKNSGADPENYLNLLTEYGFSFYNVIEQERKIESTNTKELLKKYTVDNCNDTNLFCVRKR